jgi:hypothetical protein
VCARSSVGSVPKLRAGSRQGIVKPSGLRARDHRGLVSSARATPARESEIYPAECSILDPQLAVFRNFGLDHVRVS